ncbi:MAG: hypothetical protein HC844_07975 [Tabrizicola sp.]|nr:hypothetical protein [Tabrizicola sp.]
MAVTSNQPQPQPTTLSLTGEREPASDDPLAAFYLASTMRVRTDDGGQVWLDCQSPLRHAMRRGPVILN